MKWGATDQNLWLTCRICHQASDSKEVRGTTLERTTAYSGPLMLFPSHEKCFPYIQAPQYCLLTKGRHAASPAQRWRPLTRTVGQLVWLGSSWALMAQIPAVRNKYTEFTKSDSPDQNNEFLGRNKDWDFQWSNESLNKWIIENRAGWVTYFIQMTSQDIHVRTVDVNLVMSWN